MFIHPSANEIREKLMCLKEYRVILNCQCRQIVEIIVYTCMKQKSSTNDASTYSYPSKSWTLYPLSSPSMFSLYQFQWMSFHFCIYSIWWQFVHFASKIHADTNTCSNSHEHALILIICVPTNLMSLVFCYAVFSFCLSYSIDLWNIYRHMNYFILRKWNKVFALRGEGEGERIRNDLKWYKFSSTHHDVKMRRQFLSLTYFLSFFHSLVLFCQANTYQHRKYHHTRLTCQ